MIPTLGSYSLALAILAAAGGVLAAVSAVRLGDARLLRLARVAIWTVAGLLTAAGAALMAAILRDDFRLAYVAGYSERALPVGYKLAAFWAGQEGSLLLWAWLMAAMAGIVAFARRRDDALHHAPGLGILSALCGCFAALLLFAANPFELGRMVPPDGQGLNPMLQDPNMIAHPPLLFLGYAGFAVPFALVLGALIAGRTDDLWIAPTRRWAMASWLFLTVGIVLGARWAYVELGWGGYWAWDPVENASLLPWLTGTALLHSLIVQQRRGMLKTWNAALVATTFLLCVFGTYLTRSGVIASVHAFPESRIGQFFLALLLAALAGSVGVILWRRRLLKSDHRIEKLLSREGAFLAANVLLVVMMLTTLVGTIFPLLSAPFSKTPATLEAGFYNTAVVPMGVALVALMSLGPLLDVFASGQHVAGRLVLPVVGAIAAAGAALALGGLNLWMLACAAVAGFTVLALGDAFVRAIVRRAARREQGALRAAGQLLRDHPGQYGGKLVHLGVAAIVLGVAGSSLFSTKDAWDVPVGTSVRIGRYTLRLDELQETRHANFLAVEAVVTLTAPGGREQVLRPQRRRYDKSQQFNTEVAIRSGLIEDVYLTLAGWKDQGKVARVEAIVNPLVSWIWLGGIAMTLGSAVCLLPPRARRTQPADVPAEDRAAQGAAALPAGATTE